MTRVAAMLLAATVAAFTVPASAKDLGVRGATWPVVEPDLVINAKEPWRMVDLGLRFEEMVIFC